MPKTRIRDIVVHYQQRGTGPDVILIHGFTSSLALWIPIAFPTLSGEFRLTAYDLRGHGHSGITRNGYDSKSMAEDLLALMDELGIERACLVGHSYGGSIGLHLALLRPERVEGVVLLDSGIASLRHLRNIENWPGWSRWKGPLAKLGMDYQMFLEMDGKKDVSDVIRKSFSIPVRFGFRRGQSRLTPRMKKLIDETAVGVEFREVAGLTEEALPAIRTPVLAMYGKDSPYCPIAEHLDRVLPNCCYETIDEVGHFYLLEEPGMVFERVTRFLRDPLSDVNARAIQPTTWSEGVQG